MYGDGDYLIGGFAGQGNKQTMKVEITLATKGLAM